MLGTHDPPTHAGADKGYDEAAFIADVRQLNFTPHVAPNVHARRRTSPVDGRPTRHAGYAASPRKRKLVDEGSGWGKCAGLLRKLHHRGKEAVRWIFTFTSAAYNLVRLRTLLVPARAPNPQCKPAPRRPIRASRTQKDASRRWGTAVS